MSTPPRFALVPLVSTFLLGLANTAWGTSYFLPGTIYDQDKHHSDTVYGWCNWYLDPDDSGYQPGDLIDNTYSSSFPPPPAWHWAADNSCWMATAANMLRYIGGPDMYQTWAYDQGVWCRGELRYWPKGGFPASPLGSLNYSTDEPLAYDESTGKPNGVWNNPQAVIDTIRDNLANAMPTGLGVFNPGMIHAITVVGIDTTAGTLTVTDSDNGQHNVTETFNYQVTSDQVLLSYAGGSAICGCTSLVMLPWRGSGTFSDTSTDGPTTLWSNWDNWGSEYWKLVQVQFTNTGLLQADMAVTGMKLLLKGNQTTINVVPGGSLTYEMLQNSGAHVNLSGGTLVVHQDFFHSGSLSIGAGSIFGAGNVYLGSSFSGAGQITQTGGTASMNTVVVGMDANLPASNLTVQGGQFSAGDMTIGQRGSGTYVQQGGTTNVTNLIGFAWEAGSQGTGTLSNGNITAGDMVLGNAGNGSFTHTGGKLKLFGTLVLGEQFGSSGGYTLGGSGQIEADSLVVGSNGSGNFIQDVMSSVSVNYLQVAVGSNSDYTMKTGTLTTGTMSIGLGSGVSGTFTQNQGLATVTGDLRLGASATTSNGAYTMTNGTLSAQSISVGDKGTGAFTQTGGTVHAAGTLTVCNAETANGHYTLNGGVDGATVTADRLVLGESSIFDHYRGTVTLGSDLTLASSSFAIYRLYDGTLSSPYEFIGDLNQEGTFVQTGGTNTVSNNLMLGNGLFSSGTYTISKGTLNVGQDLDITGAFNLNGGSVTADWVSLYSGSTFSSAGSPWLKVNRLWGFPANFSLSGNLYFGHSGGPTGATYAVGPGASLAVSERLLVGFDAPAVFTQTGGSVSSSSLTLGHFAGGIGTYNLSGDTSVLVTDEEFVGRNGQGNFNQSAGDHTVNGPLHVANWASGVGNFYLSGGRLSASELDLAEETNAAGTFIQDGGHVILTDGLWLARAKSSAHGVYQFVQGTLTMTGPEYIGETGAGEFYQFGGTHHWLMVPAAMYIGYSGTGIGKYAISGGNLNAGTGKIYIGYNGQGRLQISGTGLVVVDELVLGAGGTLASTDGTLRVNKLTGFGSHPSFGCSLQIGHSAGAGQGSYSVASGQSLAAHDLTVGYNAPGTLTHNGGANTITSYLVLGDQAGGNGDYTLAGAGSVSAPYQRIGSHGSGTFTQSGGTNTASSNLYLGEFAGSQGTYNLNGGSLTTHDLTVGSQGSGTVNQTAGTATVSSYLVLGEQAGGQGTYTLGGTGSVSAPYQRIGFNGSGTFTQNAGGNTASLNLYVGEFAGSHGTYNLNGGSLTAGDIMVGNGDTGEFHWNGGSLSAASVSLYSRGSMTIGNDWVYGKALKVYGGSLDLGTHVLALDNTAVAATIEMTDGHVRAADAHVGSTGKATCTQSGGEFSVDNSLFLGTGPSANGTFALSGGTLTATYEEVGYQGIGSITQTGGINRVFADLSLGRTGGSDGTYQLSGVAATLTVTNARIGRGGNGHFTQSLGSVAIAGTLSLGDYPGGGGTYELGPASLQANAEQIGVGGFGTFTQQDGVNVVGSGGLVLGSEANSMGRYELHRGSLTVAGPTVIQGRGARGDHRIVQTGGSAHYNGGLVISDQTWGGSSRYELRGGMAWVTGDLACNAQGHVLLGGTMGVMAVSNKLTLSGSLDVELGVDSAVSHLAVNGAGPGAVTLGNPAFTLSLACGYTPGASAQTWTLIDPTDAIATITGTFAGLPEGAQISLGGRVFTLSYTGGPQHNDLLLSTPALPSANAQWMGLVSSFWANASNWNPSSGVPDWTGTTVTFGDPRSNPLVDLQSTGRTVGRMTFHNSVPTSIQGTGTLTLDNNAADAPISVSGQHTISSPVSLKSVVAVTFTAVDDCLTLDGDVSEAVAGVGITKLGAGVLVLHGVNSYTGGTTVSEGVLQVTGVRALPEGGALTIGSGATVVLAGGMSVGTGSATTNVIGSQAVPEPSAVVLLAAGSLALVFLRSGNRKGRSRGGQLESVGLRLTLPFALALRFVCFNKSSVS